MQFLRDFIVEEINCYIREIEILWQKTLPMNYESKKYAFCGIFEVKKKVIRV